MRAVCSKPHARRAAWTCLPAAWLSIAATVPLGATPTVAGAAAPVGHEVFESARYDQGTWLTLRDGRTVFGHLRVVEGAWRGGPSYAARYDAWCATRADGPPPRLGDEVTLVLAAGDTVAGALRGVTSALFVLERDDSLVFTGVPRVQVRRAWTAVAEIDSGAFGPTAYGSDRAPVLDAAVFEREGALRVAPATSVSAVRLARTESGHGVEIVLVVAGVLTVLYVLSLAMAQRAALDQFAQAAGSTP
jgi:hypothetical protein